MLLAVVVGFLCFVCWPVGTRTLVVVGTYILEELVDTHILEAVAMLCMLGVTIAIAKEILMTGCAPYAYGCG